jgi:hypothetical protein
VGAVIIVMNEVISVIYPERRATAQESLKLFEN